MANGNKAIDGLHVTSRWPRWCTEQCSKMSIGNLTLFLCKTCGVIFYCFVHQHGRLITWLQPHGRLITWMQPHGRLITWMQPTWPSHHVDANQELSNEDKKAQTMYANRAPAKGLVLNTERYAQRVTQGYNVDLEDPSHGILSTDSRDVADANDQLVGVFRIL